VDWPVIGAFSIGILAATWMMSRLLPAEAQRDPRWTLVLLGGVTATALVAGVVLSLLK
jgi:hypothetical protein